MKEYSVCVTTTVRDYVTVEAENEDDAYDMVYNDLESGRMVVDIDNGANVDIEVEEVY